MKTATKLLAAAVALWAALLSLAACSSSQTGQALQQTTAPPQVNAPTSTSAGNVSTTAIDPCTLLNPSALAQYGAFLDGAANTVAGVRSCLWQRERGQASGGNLGVSVDVRDKQGTDTVNDMGGGIQRGEVNGRTAVKIPDPGGATCTLALAVSSASRVDVGVVGPYDTNESCKIATDVAYLVEPKLPKS